MLLLGYREGLTRKTKRAELKVAPIEPQATVVLHGVESACYIYPFTSKIVSADVQATLI